MMRIPNKILSFWLTFIILALPVQAQVSENSAQQFNQIDDLLMLGAAELALRILQKRQPPLSQSNQQSWLMWEKKRIQLMQKLRHWPLLIERVEHASMLWRQNSGQEKELRSAGIIQREMGWFYAQQVKAYLRLANNTAALSLLQKILWHTDEYTESEDIAMWRRLVIRSYLQMDKVEDAQRAMRRYQQDYGDLENKDGLQWTALQIQLWMRTQRYQEVIQSLSAASSDAEKALLLLAELAARQRSPQQIKHQLQQYRAKKDAQASAEYIYDFVLLKVAIADKDPLLKLRLIESFLIADKLNNINDIFYDADKYISADSLWAAYEALGYATANHYKILRGDDDAWYLRASNLVEKKPMQARAMYVVLAFNAQQQQHRTLAFEQLVSVLDKQASGIEIINALFMRSARISNIEEVPVKVRYRLVDYALLQADLKSAAKLMAKLQQPPQGKDAFAWHLRRARILIMGAQHQQGAHILTQLLASKKQMTKVEIDQIMQVMFDLQAIEQHALALQAFEQLDQYALSKKVQREMAFWKAESYQAQGQYEQAAYLFLISARPLDDKFDPWFHTASFKAAEALVQAELMGDARRQYIKLLRITKNTARRSVIKQRLQQLRLLAGKAPKVRVSATDD
jgi:hypothetical protein